MTINNHGHDELSSHTGSATSSTASNLGRYVHRGSRAGRLDTDGAPASPLAVAWDVACTGVVGLHVEASPKLEPSSMVGGGAARPPELVMGEWATGMGVDAAGASATTLGAGGVLATTVLGPMGIVEMSSSFKKSKVVGSEGEVDISEKGNEDSSNTTWWEMMIRLEWRSRHR